MSCTGSSDRRLFHHSISQCHWDIARVWGAGFNSGRSSRNFLSRLCQKTQAGWHLLMINSSSQTQKRSPPLASLILHFRDSRQQSRSCQTPELLGRHVLFSGCKFPPHVASTDSTLGYRPGISRKPAVLCRGTPNQVQVTSFIDRQSLMNKPMRIHICCHWPT